MKAEIIELPIRNARREYLTAKEVAEMLGVTDRAVYKWKAKGTIPFVKRNGMVRFRRSEIERWLDEGSHQVKEAA